MEISTKLILEQNIPQEIKDELLDACETLLEFEEEKSIGLNILDLYSFSINEYLSNLKLLQDRLSQEDSPVMAIVQELITRFEALTNPQQPEP